MTSPFTLFEHASTRRARGTNSKLIAGARANWAVAREHVEQHPGITIHELAALLEHDERITWKRKLKSLKVKLSFARNVDGAMGRAGIVSRVEGRTVRLWVREQERTAAE